MGVVNERSSLSFLGVLAFQSSAFLLAFTQASANETPLAPPLLQEVHWNEAAIPWAHIFESLTGRQYQPMRWDVVEIGPGDSPVCSDCKYLDLENQLPRDKRKNFRKGDIRQMPFRSGSIHALVTKGLPWHLQSGFRLKKSETIFQIEFVYGRQSKEDLDRRLAEAQVFIDDAFAEINRVLSPQGVVLILAGKPEFPEAEEFLELIEAGEVHGMRWAPTPKIRRWVEARKIGKETIPSHEEQMQGIILYRKSSDFLRLPLCRDLLT